MPLVCVVVLNYHRVDDTVECVQSVLKSDYARHRVVVVDNESGDEASRELEGRLAGLPAARLPDGQGQAGLLSARLPDGQGQAGVTFLRNRENLGYAGGNNVGIRFALQEGKADYVFILNNDATVAPEALRRLVEAGEGHPEATIIAPKVCSYDRPSIINSCGTTMDWFRLRPKLGACGEKDCGQFKAIEKRAILPGSALLLKRRLFDEVGMFDEQLFLIGEDTDLCLRNLRRGFTNLLVPEAIVYHKLSRALAEVPFLSAYYTARNVLYLAKRYATWMEYLASRVGLACLAVKHAVGLIAARGDERERLHGFFVGVRDYYLGRLGPYAR